MTGSRPSRGRVLLGAGGALLVGYGTLLVLTQLPPAAWLRVGLWAGGAVAAHDLLLVPLVLALAWAGRRVLPRALWGPAVLGLVATGALSAAAAAALVRGGGDSGVPGLLDRDYVGGYALALAVVWAAVAALVAVRAARARRRHDHSASPR